MDFKKKNFRNLSDQEIIDFLKDISQPSFRLKQIKEWIWKKGVSDFNEMNNLPAALKEALEQNFFIDKIAILNSQKSKADKTVKVLFKSVDDDFFEGVLIPGKSRTTACISTQVGCPLNCDFCATGKLGFSRNLSRGEIYDQVFLLNEASLTEFGQKLSNIVVMGMGEPFLNYENIIDALKIVCSSEGLAMSPQRITISTAGIIPGIKMLADENLRVNLSISLHSADDQKRDSLMPINKKYNLQQLREAISHFYKKTGERITYEYLLLKGVNDSIEDAKKLTEFTKVSPCKINLIMYNSHEKSKYQQSDDHDLKAFVEYLESKNLVVTVRRSKGTDIDAACGQLANKKKEN